MTTKTETPKNSTFAGIRQKIKDCLARDSKAVVPVSFIKTHIQPLLDEREKMIAKSYSMYLQAEKDYAAIKPSPVGYAPDGKAVGDPHYTLEQSKNRTKCINLMSDLDAALSAALDDGNWEPIAKLTKGKD
jgi:hypothetical protein